MNTSRRKYLKLLAGAAGLTAASPLALAKEASKSAAEQWLSFYQPPSVMSFGGWRTTVKSVRLLAGDKPLGFAQDDLSLRISGFPAIAPDQPATVIAIECDGEAKMSHEYV